tara:strand:+ start:137 stop:307 length:171 start_codon:yes stop_codon:yes gene_type:complete
MPIENFTHCFNPRPPDPYAKQRLFKEAKELGYVVVKKKDFEATLKQLRKLLREKYQ